MISAANRVLLQQYGDKRRRGHRDQRTHNACKGRAKQERDEYRQTHQVNGRLHNARRQHGVFKVDIDGIEDEDAAILAQESSAATTPASRIVMTPPAMGMMFSNP